MRFRRVFRGARLGTALVAAGLTVASLTSEALAQHAKVRGPIDLQFRGRPLADGTRRHIGGAAMAPLSIRFASKPTAADLAALEQRGAKVLVRRSGSPRVRGTLVLAEAPRAAIASLAAMPRVVSVSLDAIPFAPPPPLDVTASMVQATDAWGSHVEDNGPLTGGGVTVCDIDSGVDVFHPLFFRADGGAIPWIDVDGDGALTPGVDGVDPDGDGQPTVVRVLDSLLTDRHGEVLEDSDDPGFKLGWDWLYADRDGSGKREFGAKDGFAESDPTYGEPLYVVDDVNGNGKLDVDERLVALGTSKFKVAYSGKDDYVRGKNLVDFPVTDGGHGTGAMSVIAGGNRGLNRLVGIAPEVDIVAQVRGEQDGQFNPTAELDNCLAEGARVVLHEYAPWMGYFLDGSEDVEQLIDESSAEGVSHINPAGNLSTSDKMSKRELVVGGETVIDVLVPPDSPYGPMYFFGVSLIWREGDRPLGVTLETPSGVLEPLDLSPVTYKEWEGKTLYANLQVSPRNTGKIDIYLFDETAGPPNPAVETGTWKLHVTDASPGGSPPITVLGSLMDEASGWGKGIHFPELPTEDHLVGFPGTADHGLGVAAFTGHPKYGAVSGERAYYSGRGERFDGTRYMYIAAPDNPVVGGWDGETPARYYEYGGTSGASPHVAGAAALLIQSNPELKGDDVRDAIRDGALVDAQVGAAPNGDWGYGKLRIYESVYGTPPPGGTPPTISIGDVEVVAGEPGQVEVTVSDADEDAANLVVDIDREYDGTFEERLAGKSFEVSYPEPGRYVVRVRVTDSSGKEAGALATILATQGAEPEPEPEPETPDPGGEAPGLDGLAAGGGGCTSAPGGGADARWLGLAAMALALGARRRRR